MLRISKKDINKIILIGDHILIKPSTPAQRTESGLLLPQGMHKKQDLRTGYVVKVGPGYPIPIVQDEQETWKDSSESIKYVPLQPEHGDLAVYEQSGVHEILFNGEEYIICTHRDILMVIRDDDDFLI